MDPKARILAIQRAVTTGWNGICDVSRWLTQVWQLPAIRATLITSVSLVIALRVAFRRPVTETNIRFTGVALQLFGALWGLRIWNSIRNRLKPPSLAQGIQRWWETRPRWRTLTTGAQSDAASESGGNTRIVRPTSIASGQNRSIWGAFAALILLLFGATLVGTAPDIQHELQRHGFGQPYVPHDATLPDRSDKSLAVIPNHELQGKCLGLDVFACSYDPNKVEHLITPGEFLALVGLILALRALVRPSTEFRLRVAGITTAKMLIVMAISALFVVMAALLPYWSGRRWPVVGYSLAWEIAAFLLLFFGSLTVLGRAFRVTRFSKRNAQKYWEAASAFIARGGDDALAELADEIHPSVARVITVCRRFDHVAARHANEIGQDYEVSKYVRLAITILDLWSDKRFCAVMVRRAPGTAIALVEQIRTRLNPAQGGRSCIASIVDQALTQEDSLLFREEEYSPLGRYHFFTDAIASHYEFVESGFRPLEGWDWRSRQKANAGQVEKYGDLLLCALKGYFEHGDFGNNPSGLRRAFDSFSNSGSWRARRLRDADERVVNDDDNFAVLSKISDTLEKAIQMVVARQLALPGYPLDLAADWKYRDTSIYAVIAQSVYKHFESLAQVLAHDSVVRFAAISIWLELFPTPSTDSRPRHKVSKCDLFT